MAVYRYVAVDAQGREHKGVLEAADVEAARRQLAGQGLSVHEISLNADAPPQRTLSANEALEVSTYVAQLASSGLPLAAGLRAFAGEMPASRLSPQLVVLAMRLERGEPLEVAIASPNLRLPEYFVGLIAAALRSGNFAVILQEFLKHERLTEDMRWRLWRNLAYPVALLALVTAWLVFVLTTLVPQLRKIYEDFDIILPDATRILIAISDYGPMVVAGGVAVLATLLVLLRVLGGRALVSDLIASVPLFGPMWRSWSLSELSNLLRVLVEQAIPLPRALELTASGIRDAALAVGCRQAAARVAAGDSLTQSLSAYAVFPPSFLTVVDWGERTSALPQALASATDMFAARAVIRDQFLRTILGPITFIVLAAVMLFVVAAMFMPLMSLIQNLS